MMQTYFHHLSGVFGIILALWLGGFFGSMSQLTWITEASTFFVNMRAIMAYHKMQSHPLYIANGLLMTIAFFVFRICYYYFMVFSHIQIYTLYRSYSFWSLYPEDMHKWCYLAMALYFSMYILNMFWFSKIVMGSLKALGIDKAIEATEWTEMTEKDVKKKK